MSYQKVQENYQIIARNSKKEDQNKVLKQLDDVYLNYPKTFIRCPECYYHNLISCKCKETNYMCPRCEWKHINHHHYIDEKDDYRNDENFMKGAISKSVRNY